MTDTNEWQNESGTQWLTLTVIALGVLVYLLDPTGIIRGALFVAFLAITVVGIHSSYMAITNTND